MQYGQKSILNRKDSQMKKNNLSLAVLLILLGVFALSACNAVEAQPVQALAPTEAPTEVDAPAIAEEVMPARLEFPVSNGSVEVKVVDIDRVISVYLGQDPVLGTDIRYSSEAGHMFMDIGMKVTNLTGSDIPMKWSEIYVSNKHGDKWYPKWGAYQEADGAVDPLTVKIIKYDQVHPDYDPDAHYYIGGTGFVRVIFELPRTSLYYFFGFGDLPQIEIKNLYY
jgi:hypothetical protein